MWVILALLASSLVSQSVSQDQSSQDQSTQGANRVAPQTRAGQIEIEREQKAAQLKPEANSRFERNLQHFEDDHIIERVFGNADGLHVKLGGLITRSGFAAGPEYDYHLFDDEALFSATVRASTRRYYLMQTGLNFNHLASGRAFANIYARHFDYPSVEYYGPGPHSQKSGRSDYLLENTSLNTRLGVEPLGHLWLGALGQFLAVHVGPGRDTEYASTTTLYNDVTTPGLNQQGNFLEGGGFIQYDWRDNPLFPHSGGNYIAQFTTYDALDGAYSFDRLRLEAQEYIPFFNKLRTIALRARVEAGQPLGGDRIPFYLQSTLGGADDLRGYRAFRFYGNNSTLVNAEYRWQVFSGMEVALFADAGRVFDRWQDINFRQVETDFGAGWRFNMNDAVFMRIDAGFSHEGFGLWLKFGNIF
jgi:hypothetical protein